MSSRQHEIIVGRFVIPYRIYEGTDNETPIVCVNGAQQSMAAWGSLIKAFRSEFTVATFDLPGQGRSRIVGGSAAIGLDEQVDVLVAVARAIAGDRPVDVMGASWGSVIAAAYAAYTPSAVRRLVLASLALRPNPVMAQAMAEGMTALREGKKELCSDIIVNSIGAQLPDIMRKRIKAQFCALPDSQANSFYEHLVGCQTGDMRELIAFKRIDADTLIVNGRYDPIVDLQEVQMVARLIPRCNHEIIEHAGHFLHFEDPTILDLYRAHFGYRETGGNRGETVEKQGHIPINSYNLG